MNWKDKKSANDRS